jgi:multisubunit Na+/H+ antiporter MnhF subunit
MPSALLALCVLPLALAAAILIAGRPPLESLKILAIVVPFQAFGAIEAGFTIPPAYLVLFTILAGIAARGEFLSAHAPGGRQILIYLGIAVATTILAAFGPSLVPSGLDTTMQYRAGPWRSPLQLALLIFHFAVFFVIVRYLQGRDAADALLKVYLWTALVLGMFGIYQIFAFNFGLPFADCTWSIGLVGDSATIDYSSIRYYSARVASFSTRATFRESRDFGEYLLTAVPVMLALGAARSPEVRRRFGFLSSPAAGLLGATAIFFTLSRSAWLFLAVALVIIAFRQSRRLLLIHVPLAFAGLSLVAVVLAKTGYFDSSFGSLWSVITGRYDWYYILNDPRARFFLVLWESFTQHPILGLGAGNFALWGAAHTGAGLLHSAHGFVWAGLADFGLIGFAAVLFIFLGLFRRLSREINALPRSAAQRPLLVGLFAALVATFFNAQFGGDRPPFHLLFIVGLAVAYIAPFRGAGKMAQR